MPQREKSRPFLLTKLDSINKSQKNRSLPQNQKIAPSAQHCTEGARKRSCTNQPRDLFWPRIKGKVCRIREQELLLFVKVSTSKSQLPFLGG